MATTVTILYDEGCGFCTAVAGRLAKRDGVVAAEIASPAGDAALERLSHDERYASFHVVDGDGRMSSTCEAVAVLLATLPAGGVTSRLARTFPRLTEALYRRATKHRDLLGRLFRVDACAADSR